jgi:hypothetical protein
MTDVSGMLERPHAPSRATTAILDDKGICLRYRPAMITIAASNFWYFSFDSSLAVGGSRSI